MKNNGLETPGKPQFPSLRNTLTGLGPALPEALLWPPPVFSGIVKRVPRTRKDSSGLPISTDRTIVNFPFLKYFKSKVVNLPTVLYS